LKKNCGELKKFLVLILVLVFALLQLPSAMADRPSRVTEIEILSDGSALWTVESKFSLDTPDNEIQTLISSFESTLNQKAENAEVLTGRSMEIKNFTASGPVQIQDYKKVRYEFTWTNFAEKEGDELRVGDAIEAGFLDLPTAADVLTIKYPAGYGVREVTPEPKETRDRELTWYGEQSFSFGRPSITLVLLPSPWPPLMIIVVISCGVIAAWFFWFKRLFKPLLKTAEKPELPRAERVLKSETERAIEILKEAGGKMYQTELVRRLDISKSKGSALLNSMEQRGEIQRMRMGRKNLIILKPATEEPEK
jgi:uncharacterized membrane protein